MLLGGGVRMRPTKKLLLVLTLSGAALTLFSYLARCSTHSPLSPAEPLLMQADSSGGIGVGTKGKAHLAHEIKCVINDDYAVPCRKEGSEVFVPFSFLRKYFEVYGKIAYRDGKEVLDWQHSYSKVMAPNAMYHTAGPFLWFENYNVAVRDRVKCISGMEGVPISTQWDPKGHFYPVQIAQFGLSHFSKNFTEPPPSVALLENGVRSQHGSWVASSKLKASYSRLRDDETEGHVFEFRTSGTAQDQGVAFALKQECYNLTMSVDLRVILNGSLSVVLTAGSADKPSLYGVHYIMTDTHLAVDDHDVYYGIGTQRSWMHLTRDLAVDLVKGLSFGQRKMAARPRNLRVHSIVFRGYGLVDNLTLTTSAHEAHFFDAAEWLVRHQDDTGGWPIQVTRRLSNGMLELEPGWYSAMAQGQAMSVLTRAYLTTGERRYLDAALHATAPFKVRAETHGVMTTFLGKFVWYEEYPTVPSSFVLNGFIYSLFGLYDVKSTCGDGAGSSEQCRDAEKLFLDGMVSLKRMLPLFDTGSGTTYDLRHFSLGVAPNLARWDYHTTHINQLLYLATIDDDPIFKTTADRWIQYMKGFRAPHN